MSKIFEVNLVYKSVPYGNVVQTFLGNFRVAAEDADEALKIASADCRGEVIFHEVKERGSCQHLGSKQHAPALGTYQKTDCRRFEQVWVGPTDEVELAANEALLKCEPMSGPHLQVTRYWDGTAKAELTFYSLD